ncbi:MAG: glycosyltransferase [Clostridia bacterium]|nr:glycosyltransferase [Clostridia bacterium]
MKILIVASNMVHINNFHRPYIEGFKAEGHNVLVMASGEGADFNIDFKKRSLSLKNLKLSYKIREILNKENFDAVYLHTSLAAFWVRMALRGVKKRPYVINTVHGYLFGGSCGFFHNKIYLACEKMLKNQTDDIVVMNEEDYKIASENKLCKGNVYFSCGMGVSFRECDTKIEKADKDKISLAFVGEISKRKNQMFLVKAMKHLPDYTLTLVGDGDGREKIESYIKKEGIQDRVFITGFTKKAYEYILGCDIYVSASKIEGLPFNIMEAMHLKKPIVASNIKGHSDLLSKSSLYTLNNVKEYIGVLTNTDICRVDYGTDKYSLESAYSENMEIYLSRLSKNQPSVVK